MMDLSSKCLVVLPPKVRQASGLFIGGCSSEFITLHQNRERFFLYRVSDRKGYGIEVLLEPMRTSVHERVSESMPKFLHENKHTSPNPPKWREHQASDEALVVYLRLRIVSIALRSKVLDVLVVLDVVV